MKTHQPASNIFILLAYDRQLGKLHKPDYDDIMWTPVRILDHLLMTSDMNDIHILVKVLWRTRTRGWIREEVKRTDEPYLLIQFAHNNRLFKEEGWQWVLRYVKMAAKLPDIRSILNASRNKIKYKFGGVLVPYSVKNALNIDTANGNNEWRKAMDTELDQIKNYETFQTIENDILPEEYKRIPYQMIFDVKFDLQKKARLVAGGHKTEPIYPSYLHMADWYRIVVRRHTHV